MQSLTQDGTRKVIDADYEVVARAGFPQAKWDQTAYVWSASNGSGYARFEKKLIVPDPVANPCTITYTALTGNLNAGFQTINGSLRLSQ